MAVTTYGTLTVEQRTYYVARTLGRLLPYLPLLRDAQTETIPANSGTAIQWRKWGALPAATAFLTEGQAPSEDNPTVTAVTAALAQYGAFVKVSDLLIRAGIDPAMANVTDLLGEQAGLSIHTLTVTQLTGGGNVQYAGAATSTATITNTMLFTVAEVREAVRTMEKNNVPRFPDNLYHGACTPGQKYDLKADAATGGFIDIMKYAQPESFITGRLGDVEGVAFDLTTTLDMGAVGSAGARVHAAVMWGPRAFGAIDLSGMTVGGLNAESTRTGIDLMIVPANTPSKIDPLQQYGTAGWKVAYAAKILDTLRVLEIETGVSAGGW